MYSHLFFDLDRTLWDFETNSYETLTEIIERYQLVQKGLGDIDLFVKEYYVINDKLWEEYRVGTIDKETLRYERFRRALIKYGITDNSLINHIGNDYVNLSPIKTNLIPYTKEVLSYLYDKYELYIITNGFEEVQHIKLKESGIDSYFKDVITSERAGCKKPDERIFKFSMKLANAHAKTSLMIGDCLVADIGGARNAGIHQVFFNPNSIEHNENVTYEIKSLNELKQIV